MPQGEEQLKRIQDKLQQLLKQYSALQKENKILKEELDKTKTATLQQHRHVEELSQQVNILKLNAGDMSEADKKDFEKRINSYIKDIDRCIAMLSE